jgi:O-antigen/teichoic acid export membrane protein
LPFWEVAVRQRAIDKREDGLGHEARIVRGAGITIIGTVVGGGLFFINEIMLARTLGASTYGLFALAYVLARIGQNISLFGLSAALLHFMPVYLSQGRRDHVIGTVLAALQLVLVLGIAFGGALMLSSSWIANHIFDKPGAASYIHHLAFVVPFMGLTEILAVVTRGFGYSKYYVVVSNWTPPVVILIGLILIKILNAPPIWVTWALIAGYGAATLVGLFCVVWIIGRDLWNVKPVFEFRRLYGYALPLLVNALLYLTMQWSDVLLLGYFVSDEGVGIYRACFQIVVIFDMIIFPVNAAASHVVPILNDRDLREQKDRTFGLVTLLVFGMSVPLFFLIALHAPAILTILGSNYAAGAGVLTILAAGRLIRNALGSSAFFLVLRGHQAVETRNAAAAASWNVAVNVVLIPLFGIFGAAVGTSLGEVILGVLRVRQVRLLMGVRVSWWLLLRMALVSSIVAVLIGLAEKQAGVDARVALPTLLVWLVGSGVVFVITLWLFGLGTQDRKLLTSLIRRPSGADAVEQ